VGAKSPNSLYVPALASFTMGAEYDSTDADGFIRLFALPAKVGGIVRRKTTGRKKGAGKKQHKKAKRRS
jgi:argininosuccinate synthase